LPAVVVVVGALLFNLASGDTVRGATVCDGSKEERNVADKT